MKHLNRIEEYVMLATFPPMLLVVLAATFSRYFGMFSIHWGEEAARYLMIWLGFAGVGYGFKMNAHLGLTFIVSKCPPPLQRILVALRAAAIILFGCIVTWFSWLIIEKQWRFKQISPSLHIPMWMVYFALIFGGVLIIVRTVQSLLPKKGDAEAAPPVNVEI